MTKIQNILETFLISLRSRDFDHFMLYNYFIILHFQNQIVFVIGFTHQPSFLT